MAKPLQFLLNAETFDGVPVKLDRSKLYGHVDSVATDANGGVCITMTGTWKTAAMPKPNGMAASKASCNATMSLRICKASQHRVLVLLMPSLTIMPPI